MFFQTMASRIQETQDNLNKVWMQVTNSSANSTSGQQRSGGLVGNILADFQQDNFFRSLGFPGGPQQSPDGSLMSQQRPQLAGQISELWNNQVMPQVGKVRSMIARTWQDLTQSGTQFSFSAAPRSMQAPSNVDNQTLDSLFQGIMLRGPEYSLDSSESVDNQQQQQRPQVNNQLSDRLTTMQKDINRMWLGLTNSLQSALTNVRHTLNRPHSMQMQPFEFNGMPPQESRNIQPSETDKAEKEVRDKLVSLAGAQTNAEQVHNVLQQQQSRNKLQAQKGLFDIDLPAFFDQAPVMWQNFKQNTRQHFSPSRFASPQSTSTTSSISTPTSSSTAAPERSK